LCASCKGLIFAPFSKNLFLIEVEIESKIFFLPTCNKCYELITRTGRIEVSVSGRRYRPESVCIKTPRVC